MIAHYDIPWRQVLNQDGVLVGDWPENVAADEAKTLYEWMVKVRHFDKKAIALQRTGKLGTYPSVKGAEAFTVGTGMAMETDDVLCPYYRDVGAQLIRGVKMEEVLLYWGGDERGSQFEHCPRDFPICVPIASQTLYGAGAAFALKHQKTANVVVATIGDGGTSRGDFYEAMNVAAVWSLPIVFVVNNNQWAISVPYDSQTGAQTLAQKGLAAGIQGIQIDGNDVIGVLSETRKAIAHARSGKGPALIEMMSYRMSDHTTADDASRYRPTGELEENSSKDPIQRMRTYLENTQQWDDKKEQILNQNVTAAIESSVKNYLETPPQSPESAFESLYHTLPEVYLDQWETLKGRRNG
ncbi:MAG: pyruvate dehydrogenase (acetyl-transferring) E1 component subunit alpha [Legionellales bacterium]|nr:pyruvate dehydrogenase (acetyl-transferring) E1 component subunit alpha [Legionellales bacterium]